MKIENYKLSYKYICSLFICTLILGATPKSVANAASYHTNNWSAVHAPSGLYEKIPNREAFKALEPKIRELALALIQANEGALKRIWRLEGPINPSELKISLLHMVPKSNYVEVSIYQPRSLDYTSIRTNGEFAFLSASYLYRENDKAYSYKAVGYNNGRIQTYNQTELIISTLPDTVTISRSMSEEERYQWINNIPYRSKTFGAKVHFAPNYFLFNNLQPYLMTISKSELLQFHYRNELEVNTYDPLFEDEMKLTELGLEFEYVFVGESAIDHLRSLIQNQLR